MVYYIQPVELPAYVAPEVINRKGYDGAKTDIWSCGVILYVLLAGYLPFRDPNLMEMYRKIGKGEFKCPNWFAPEVRKLLSKILDPNPNTRISMAKIMENSWVRKGLQFRPCVLEAEVKDPAPSDPEAVFGINETSCAAVEPKQELAKPCNLNAFDIISFSAGFDLSGLFEEKEQKKEVRFTSNKPASTIISKLEDISKRLRLKIMKKDGGLLKIEGSKEGRKGVMGIDAEIFEITPYFHLVEMKKVQWRYRGVSEGGETRHSTCTQGHCLELARRTTGATAFSCIHNAGCLKSEFIGTKMIFLLNIFSNGLFAEDDYLCGIALCF
ncbi:hypothetical protein OIU77_020494 [Salix suchowensis]|uniref:non-specific serine/threonine protein kinase n=1 Tax=Salix suchowensis TaxID=1278906 RepID=A0ABQ9C6M0_9ROSI|nr:hypothetical protein OIU77_020494 [Salix suchowensis]